MVALCLHHHAAADRGIYSASELRAFKKSSRNDEDVKAFFPWSKKQFLVRLGGCYSGGTTVHLSFGRYDILALNRLENGLLAVSLLLPASDGSAAVLMRDNAFEAFPQQLHDLDVNTGPTHVRVWWKPRDVGLDLSFQRLTLEELDEVLDRDEADLLQLLAKERLQSQHEWHGRQDVTEWAIENALDDEHKVAFLDIRNLHVLTPERELRVRDGITVSGCMISYVTCFDNAGGSFCL